MRAFDRRRLCTTIGEAITLAIFLFLAIYGYALV